MAEKTKIQWADTTVNPVMGCGGCELFPKPKPILRKVDGAIKAVARGWKTGHAESLYREIVDTAYRRIKKPRRDHLNEVTTTNIHHGRETFLDRIRNSHGGEAKEAAEKVLAQEITCYAASSHLNRGLSVFNPGRKTKAGYAPAFETVPPFSWAYINIACAI